MNDRGSVSLIPWPLLAVLVSMGLVLRVAPLFQEFWYDEVVSLRIALKAPGASFIFFPPRLLDTPLNQIVLRAIGPSAPEWCFRLPSLLEGTAALLLLHLAARGSGPRVSRVALLLGTFSYMMVHYCSEARGYAAAMFLALAAFLALEKLHGGTKGKPAPLCLFWVASILGFLSHPSFVLFSAGGVAYSAAGVFLTAGGSTSRRSELFKAHGPVAFFVCAYLLWFHGQILPEPLPYDPAKVALDFLDFSFGVPGWVSGWWMTGPLGLVSVAIAAGVADEWRNGRRERCALLACSTFVSIAVFVAGRPAAFFPRYLFVLLPFLLLETARGAVFLWDRSTAGRLAAAAFLAVFLAGNGYHLYRFFVDGRGHYRDAFLEMAARTEGGTITLGADNDDRLEALLWFRKPDIERSTGKTVRLVTHREYFAGADPEWVILHSYDRAPAFPPIIATPGDDSRSYRFFRLYPHYGLSGFSWALYRR